MLMLLLLRCAAIVEVPEVDGASAAQVTAVILVMRCCGDSQIDRSRAFINSVTAQNFFKKFLLED